MHPFRSYLFGFFLSFALTCVSFLLVYLHLQSGHVSPTHAIATVVLALLALAQFCVQTYFFLHLGQDARRQWDATLFAFALIVVGIIVGGTLYIMQNLSEGHAAARQIYSGDVVSPQTQND